MNREQFHDYLDRFQAGDFDGFSRYYCEDVVFNLSGGKKIIHGRQGIVDFYREVLARIREDMTLNYLVIDETGVAAEMDTTFTALEDWPDFISKPMKKGEQFQITSWAHYTLRDGKFATIKSVRYPR